MRLSPTSDIVTRVFMLFRGVCRAQTMLVLWAPAARPGDQVCVGTNLGFEGVSPDLFIIAGKEDG